ILPDVPTIAEAGPLPGYAVDVWLGVMAPAGTPRPVVDRLNAEINKTVRDPQVVRERLNTVGLEAVGSTPEQLLETMKTELAKYTTLARDAGIKPEQLGRRLPVGLESGLGAEERRRLLQVLLPQQRFHVDVERLILHGQLVDVVVVRRVVVHRPARRGEHQVTRPPFVTVAGDRG